LRKSNRGREVVCNESFFNERITTHGKEEPSIQCDERMGKSKSTATATGHKDIATLNRYYR
jgi:hypothetical protein